MNTIVLAGTPPLTITWETLIEAIGQCESHMNHAAVGAAGERGAWQMSLVAWVDTNEYRQEFDKWEYPHSHAHKPAIGREYASMFAELTHDRLCDRLGRAPTVQELWAAWNLGVRGFQRIGYDLARVPDTTKRGIARLEEWVRKNAC